MIVECVSKSYVAQNNEVTNIKKHPRLNTLQKMQCKFLGCAALPLLTAKRRKSG